MNVITAQKAPALRVERLAKTFDVSAPWLNRVVERKPRQFLHAVNDISFDVPMSGCLSLVGESGCGKSTVARLVTGLYKPNSGEMRFAPGRDGNPLSAQMIFQDPYASLNPRWRVKNIIAEPLRELKLRKTAAEITERVVELLKIVGPVSIGWREVPARILWRAAAAHLDCTRTWRANRSSWSAMSRPPRWTFRSRLRSSI